MGGGDGGAEGWGVRGVEGKRGEEPEDRGTEGLAG